MEYRCCVLGCLKTSNNGVGLHEFPFDNQALLPVWIMATNRADWLPVVKSRICNRHFSIDDYEDGNKNNNLKTNACPMFNTPSNAIENSKEMTDSDISDVDISSTSDINFSDLNTDDLLDTPNTSDMKFSDDDSILSISSITCNLNKTTGFRNKHFQPSNSYNQTDQETTDIRSINCVHNSVALSSTEKNFGNIHRLNNNKCAVVFCNEKARLKFDQLFFIDFPKDKELCDTWWKICGHNNTFDSSFKICSIHFDVNDFTTVTIKQGDQLNHQTVLKNFNIVPTLYLLPHEFARLIRKRKNTTITDNNRTKILNTSQIVNCSIQGCKNISLKNEKIGLFFKFPLENKVMLNKWLNNIGVPNWQPSETDRICSDHIKYYNINQLVEGDKEFSNCNYDLQIHAISSNKPKICKDSTNKGEELNFENLHEDILIMEKNEIESNLLNSSRSIIDHKQVFTTAAMQSDLTDRDTTKEQPFVYSPKKFKKSNLEYFMNIFNNDSNGSNFSMNGGSQFQNKTTSSATKLYLESFEKEIADEVNIIPKSKNNGNDRDYIYLDMLNGDDVGEFLTFEKKYIPKNTKSKIPELIEKKQTKGIPKSIIYDSDLTECYGEMLPATCDTDCQLICYYSIPGPQRREIYNQFQILHNVTEQNCKITQLVKLRLIKKSNETFECCPLYHLIMNSLTVKVCRTFFINTLGITENRLNGVLKPINYSWYSDKDTALKANLPNQVKVTGKSVLMTDFMRESLKLLDNDYNLYEPESDSEVNLENVPFEEYEKVFSYIKGIPRVLSSYQAPGELKKQFFETSICLDYIYKSYSENYIRNNIPPPYTKRQFKIIYNQYMKTFLK
ncbi:Hypothetical protein CINCED_3A008515 [Cinara cedri]|uniref:THAP-type domain-containing protein n=1 Tax=Cinara cedri TaxID=506608 RepID=A0A5E4MLI4_9HEMI|nr:Hypothetical protein CINCED_3A008515 [Cinara cedri]